MSFRHAILFIWIVALSLSSIHVAAGADIARQSRSDFDLIGLQGEITPEDVANFRSAADASAKAVVILDSGGGAALAGIEMGKVIHRKKFATFVPEIRFVLRLALSCGWPGTRD
jgi:hypothetical protein